jgi:hypothetical protein
VVILSLEGEGIGDAQVLAFAEETINFLGLLAHVMYIGCAEL